MKSPYFSLIIPCYNEGPTLQESVGKIINVLSNLKQSWEIIFVEDKSNDETRATVEKLAKKIKNSKAIFHKKNEGRGKSVSDGILASRGKICGYLDVDLEVSANYIAIFIDEVEKGAQLVIGKRFYEGGLKTLSRFLASKVYSNLVSNLLKIPVDDTEAGYKFFARSKILPVLKTVHDNGWFWDTEICARSYFAGLKISQVPVLFVRRTDKRSTVKLLPDSWDYFVKVMRFRKQVPKGF